MKHCIVQDEGRLRIVTLNRPEVMNALHSEAHFELEKVWDENTDPFTNAIRITVMTLRRKLGEGLIATVRGQGYRLVEPAAG